jgi:nuclear pore complex protein Nup93
MNISVEQYKQLKQSTAATNGLEQQVIKYCQYFIVIHCLQALADIRSQAQAVILFAGMIPYRLPADTNGRLVQLEAYLS